MGQTTSFDNLITDLSGTEENTSSYTQCNTTEHDTNTCNNNQEGGRLRERQNEKREVDQVTDTN